MNRILGIREDLPLPIMGSKKGEILVIDIPRMSKEEFVFFQKLLDLYEVAIIIPPSKGQSHETGSD